MLKDRIFSALLMIPVPLLAVWYGSPWFDLLAVFIGALMAWEWDKMLTGKAGVHALVFGVVTAVASLMVVPNPAFVVPVVAVASGFFARAVYRSGEKEWKLLAFGVPYIALSMASLVYIEHMGGAKLIYWLLAIVWATDIGAYAFGSTIGGPKLAPSISPKKTWAGLLGGMACAALAGLAIAVFLGSGREPRYAIVLFAGAGGAVVAQLGDLFESFVKRRLDLKDSSQLIPGHGGIFDRIDGLIFAAPAIAVTMIFLAHF